MLASLLLGVVISLQFRSSRAVVETPQGERTELIALVKSLESERNKLSAELTETRDRLGEIEAALGQGQSMNQQLNAQFESARVQAGLMSMKGPGVVVRMADSPRKPGQEEDPYFYIVHDVDIQALVNELWAAGAEAVSVNDQRIVTRSSIRCVGPTILVNANRLASPYIIKAIGPASDLEGGLRMPGGYIDSMSALVNNGGEVVVSRLQEVVVPTYHGSLVNRYAKPVEGAGSSTGATGELTAE
ncbi:MAG: DUF881 domain-containing protein [Vulcanimicrobiota bacterium]